MSVYCTRCGAAMDENAQFCPICGNPIGAQSAAPAPAVATTPPFSPPPPSAPAVRYGGFWVRFVAVVIDSLLVSVVTGPISMIIGIAIATAGMAVRMPNTGVQIVSMISGFTIGVLGNWLYEALMMSSARQSTLGKMLFHLRVTDLAGNRIGFGQATGRHFAKYLSAMILFVGYLMAAFTERHQALHDLVAGTLVRHD